MNLPENIRNFIEKEAELDSGRAQKIQAGINMFSHAYIRGAEALYQHLLSIGPEFDKDKWLARAADYAGDTVGEYGERDIMCAYYAGVCDSRWGDKAIIAARDAELKAREAKIEELQKMIGAQILALSDHAVKILELEAKIEELNNEIRKTNLDKDI